MLYLVLVLASVGDARRGGMMAFSATAFSATALRAPRQSSSRAGGHVDVAHVGINER